MKKFFGVGVLFGLIWLFFWPTPIDPVSWEAPPAPALEGVFQVNRDLSNVERLELDSSYGPEDVAIDLNGHIYGGLQDGRIVRFHGQTLEPETFAQTGGRPLGLHFDAFGNLIVADAYKGLLCIDSDGGIKTLSTESEGLPFAFTDDVDIAGDGTIYFTDASHKFNQANYRLDAMEHRPNGRLLAYNPETQETRTVLADLYFANGVAVSPNQQYVLVNETWAYRVRRYWLEGPKQGTSDIFIDNLPGFPDGISAGADGFWLAIASPRNPLVDRLADKPFLRNVIVRLPESVQPDAKPYAFVLGLDFNGAVIHNLQEPEGKPFKIVTSVQEQGSTLYLGSLKDTAIGRIPLPKTKK